MRILFITSTRIGDAVLSSGLLAHLIAEHPEARITVACGPLAAPLFAHAPHVERVIVLEKHPLGAHWLKLWGGTVTRLWHLVVDLRRTATSFVVPTLRRRIMGRAVPGVHKVAQYGRVLGLDPPPAPRIWAGAAAQEAAKRLVPPGPPVLALGPTANWPGKEWRAGLFTELARRLAGPRGVLPGARLAVFSSPDERARALPVLDAVPAARRLDLAGTIDLPTAHECLARCAFYVGNDSGLMHLAAAAGVPTLGLFGPSKPEHYAPWGPHCAFVRTAKSYHELVGGPGYDHRTTGTLMDSLTVEMADAAARDLWTRVVKERA